MSQTFSRLRGCTRWLLAVSCFFPLVTQFAISADAQVPGQNGDAERPAQIQGVASVLPAETPAYRIGVEDVLFISVWREPDLTREVPVRPDGKISLPLIQDVHAAGKTPAELSQEIDSKLRAFLSSPAVTVVVREVNSLKVYLLGEVTQPGPVTIRSETRLLQAISMVGGVTAFGGRNGVVIYRKTDSGEKTFKVSYKDIVAGKRPQDNVILEPGDTIVVH